MEVQNNVVSFIKDLILYDISQYGQVIIPAFGAILLYNGLMWIEKRSRKK